MSVTVRISTRHDGRAAVAVAIDGQPGPAVAPLTSTQESALHDALCALDRALGQPNPGPLELWYSQLDPPTGDPCPMCGLSMTTDDVVFLGVECPAHQE